MYVACSTQCFGRHSLEDALSTIAELGFSKFDAAIHEGGRQLRPSEVAADIAQALGRLRPRPGLAPGAFSVQMEVPGAHEEQEQLQAICRLARLASVPLITLFPLRASQDTPEARARAMDAETERLAPLLKLASGEGILLALATQIGGVTEDPDQAVELCKRLPGLVLTLDPSHYLVGPCQGADHEQVMPYVRHVHLRDTGRAPGQMQVRVGQGEIEYGRIVTQLARLRYDRLLTVDIRDVPDAPYAILPEVRKLKYLLESLV